MRESSRRGDRDDDLLARSVEALAVLLDAGISPGSVWAYLAEDAEHPAIRATAERIAAGVPPSEALADAARRSGVSEEGAVSIAGRVRAGRARSGRLGEGRLRRARPVKAPTKEARAPDAGVDTTRTMGSWTRGLRAATRTIPSREAGELDHGAATVAAAWIVAEHAGAALSPALRGAATALRDRAETARDVRTSLAGPRASARLMAWLPLVGFAMACVIGVDVVGALVGGPLGWGASGAGASLMMAGRAWTAQLVREASRAGPIAGAEFDLMAIALAGGMSPAHARRLVAETRARIGLPGAEDDRRAVERVLRIAERAGAPAIELLSAEAQQERRNGRADGRTRAELLGVRLLLPLGLCVLPAFVLLAVVPVILAMISSTFAGLK